MKKPISRQAHGLIDYAYVAAVSALPELAGFSEEKNAKLFCRSVAGTILAATALTRAEWGLIKLLPFKGHLMGDVAVSLIALAAPWALKFSGNAKARHALVAVGLLGLAATFLTRNEEMPGKQYVLSGL